MEPKFQLSDLFFDFVSLVPAGDDPMAEVVIAKSAPADVQKRKSHSSRTHPGLDRSPKENWVDQVGGLPSFIERIAKHLHADEGMTISRAIATAVSRCKVWAAGGGGVKPETRAKAAKAIAEWERKKAKAHMQKVAKAGYLHNKPHAFKNKEAKNGDRCDDCGQGSDSPMHKVSRKRRMSKSGVQDQGSSTLSTNSPGMEEAIVANELEIEKDDLPDEVVTYIDTLEETVDDLHEKVTKAEADVADLQAKLEAAEDEDKPKGDDVAKGDPFQAALAKADPQVAEVLKSLKAQADEAENIAKAEREARHEREALSKAEALPMITTDKAELARLLRTIGDKLDPADVEKVEGILKAANEQITKGNLFTEFGSGGVETTVSKSVDAKAEALRKADPNLTMEQARAKVYEADPTLYEEALKEG